MTVFRAIVFAGALAGLAVGILVSVAQLFVTAPLIAQGEVYEKAAPAPAANHDHGAPGHVHGAQPATPPDEGWEPADGFERNAYTLLFNVVERTGWGLALAGALVMSGRRPTWREGLFWGLGGFAAFVLAPGLGLPPELPGIPAAPLGARQVWWIATGACTAGGLWLLAFRPAPAAALAALALLAAPHLAGAPILDNVATAVPAALSRRFVIAVTLTTFGAWAALGMLTGHLAGRFLAVPDGLRPSGAHPSSAV